MTMTYVEKKALALAYLKAIDSGKEFFSMFADDAQVWYPKWGLANGIDQIQKMFMEVGGQLAWALHDYAYFNYIADEHDMLVVEGGGRGALANGTAYQSGVTHAGRWCDVFEMRDGKIQRLFIYLDPDYGGRFTDYPWMAEDGTNPGATSP